MAGLNCGSVSSITWPAIRDGLDAGVAVTDNQTRAAIRRLNAAALAHADHRAALAVADDSALV
jgi:diaminopropionate ammonia-lyase